MTRHINNNDNDNAVYHAPLLVDAHSQRSFRRWGHVAWPQKTQQNVKSDNTKSSLFSLVRRSIDNIVCIFRTSLRS